MGRTSWRMLFRPDTSSGSHRRIARHVSKTLWLDTHLRSAVASLTVAGGSGARDPNCYLNYPNIPGQTLLDNDRLVVQKFIVKPGRWEGIHSHPGNQLFVHLKGGTWAVRFGDKETVTTDPDGAIGWYNSVNLSQKHQSGNVGTEPIELPWITLKPCDAGPAKN